MGETNMKVGDLCCGAGGSSLGFDYLEEFELVYALDNWDVACKSYKVNFPYVDVDCRDALEVKPQEIPKVDVLIGSPPCQEFTIVKERKLGKFTPKERTFDLVLTEWFLKVVDYMKPNFWIMENVPSVKNFLNGDYRKEIYRMSDYGIPQIRKRLFAGRFNEPKKEPTKILFPTVINEAGGVTYRPPNLGIRLGSVFRRRSLIMEAKLVQTFPLDYILFGNLNEQYQQIANAVPPLMAYRLAEALVNPTQKLLLGGEVKG